MTLITIRVLALLVHLGHAHCPHLPPTILHLVLTLSLLLPLVRNRITLDVVCIKDVQFPPLYGVCHGSGGVTWWSLRRDVWRRCSIPTCHNTQTVVSATKDIIAGSIRGVAQLMAGHPLDTVKVRLQTQSSAVQKYSGLWDCFFTTLKEEGVRISVTWLPLTLCSLWGYTEGPLLHLLLQCCTAHFYFSLMVCFPLRYQTIKDSTQN